MAPTPSSECRRVTAGLCSVGVTVTGRWESALWLTRLGDVIRNDCLSDSDGAEAPRASAERQTCGHEADDRSAPSTRGTGAERPSHRARASRDLSPQPQGESQSSPSATLCRLGRASGSGVRGWWHDSEGLEPLDVGSAPARGTRRPIGNCQTCADHNCWPETMVATQYSCEERLKSD